jgi:uncharacterized protein
VNLPLDGNVGTMSDPKTQEPSMEEILASIRRIISEEGGGQPGTESPAPAGAEKPPSADVLELTDVVEADGSVTTLGKEPAASVAASNPPPPTPPSSADEALLSERTAAASFGSLAELASAVARQEMVHSDIPLGMSERTLEGLIAELLRPMLREWLDRNLPGLIDRIVRREIEKLVRRAEGR